MHECRSIAEHSKFFEVEPDELWEEFFEFVDEVPSLSLGKLTVRRVGTSAS